MEAIAFCNIAVMPVRETASHQAEMVTQLLFGEAYKIINYESNGWAKILTLFDNYEKWEDGTEPDDDVTLIVLKRLSSQNNEGNVIG